ncbi:MAG: phosphonate ABC transporter ATP-binding protein [Desulfovibrionales bacterium]
MLAAKRLTKDFGSTRAVNNINLAIPQGQMVGVIGSSGAGKSTFLRLINRLIDPTEGSLFFDGMDIGSLKGKELRRWRAHCAMIFQQFNLVERLDVITNVLIGLVGYRGTIPTLIKHFSRTERALAVKALERLDIHALALQRADTLSGGQQQRVAIARALVQNPRLVLADEPIASLDPHNAAKVMEALRDINLKDKITVICNLHQVNTACSFCDRIIGMSQGKIVFDGAPEALTEETARQIYATAADSEELCQALQAGPAEAGERKFAAV